MLPSRQPDGPNSPAVVQPTTCTPAKDAVQLQGQFAQIVLCRAKEHHQRHVGLRHRGMKFARCLTSVGGAGMTRTDA